MKKTIDEIFVLRGIACLSVVMVHLSAEVVVSLRESYLLMGFTVLNRAMKYTTPAFIFISGLILFYVYKDRDFKYLPFIKKRLSTILIPYFIWTVIYYGYFIYKGYYTFSLKFFIENLLLGKMSFHLYFILTITQFYLLFGVFRFLFKRYNSHLVIALSAVANILFLKYVNFQYEDRFFMQYLFFFSLGCYVATHLDFFKALLNKWKYAVITFHIGIVLYYAYQFYQYEIKKIPIDGFSAIMTWFIFSAISIISLYYVSMMITKRSKLLFKGLKEVSNASYYIYLSHPLMLIISNEILNKFGIISTSMRFLLNGVIVVSVVLTLAILYSRLKGKLRIPFIGRQKVTGAKQ